MKISIIKQWFSHSFKICRNRNIWNDLRQKEINENKKRISMRKMQKSTYLKHISIKFFLNHSFQFFSFTRCIIVIVFFFGRHFHVQKVFRRRHISYHDHEREMFRWVEREKSSRVFEHAIEHCFRDFTMICYSFNSIHRTKIWSNIETSYNKNVNREHEWNHRLWFESTNLSQRIY